MGWTTWPSTSPWPCSASSRRAAGSSCTRAPKSDLAGFYDPCPTEEKQVLIKYLYQDVMHQVLAKEEETVKIPRSAHRLSSPEGVTFY